MSEDRVRRTDAVRVKLAPEMLERVEGMAADYGMPAATFCAFAVGDYVRRAEQQAQWGRMAVLDFARRSGEALGVDEGQLERILVALMPEVVRTFSSVPEDGAGQAVSSAGPQAAAGEGAPAQRAAPRRTGRGPPLDAECSALRSRLLVGV